MVMCGCCNSDLTMMGGAAFTPTVTYAGAPSSASFIASNAVHLIAPRRAG